MGNNKKTNTQLLLIIIIMLLFISGITGIVTSNSAQTNIVRIGREYSPQIDACMEIKFTVTEAHLWFEETITGYEDISSYDVTLNELGKAEFYVGSLLEGGENYEGSFLPVSNKTAQVESIYVKERLHEFIELTKVRFDNISSKQVSDDLLDSKYDDIFNEIISHTDIIETIIQVEMRETISKSENNLLLARILIIVMFILVLGISIVLKYNLQHAKDSNPLSGLPGNLTIQKVISSQLKKKKMYSIVYVDLDDFKAYNDKYGFSRGDEVLKMTAELLEKILKEYDYKESFLGHVGGDDFIIMVEDRVLYDVLEKIIKTFDKQILMHYRNHDIKNGEYISFDRNGNEKSFGIVSISLAGVQIKDLIDKEYNSVISICTGMKKIAKETKGSSYKIFDHKS